MELKGEVPSVEIHREISPKWVLCVHICFCVSLRRRGHRQPQLAPTHGLVSRGPQDLGRQAGPPGVRGPELGLNPRPWDEGTLRGAQSARPTLPLCELRAPTVLWGTAGTEESRPGTGNIRGQEVLAPSDRAAQGCRLHPSWEQPKGLCTPSPEGVVLHRATQSGGHRDHPKPETGRTTRHLSPPGIPLVSDNPDPLAGRPRSCPEPKAWGNSALWRRAEPSSAPWGQRLGGPGQAGQATRPQPNHRCPSWQYRRGHPCPAAAQLHWGP